MNFSKTLLTLALTLGLTGSLSAQTQNQRAQPRAAQTQPAPAQAPANQQQPAQQPQQSTQAQNNQSGQTFEQALASARQDLESALQELNRIREQIKDEKIPLSRELTQLEDEVIGKRREADRLLRLRDTRGIDLNALQNEVKMREDEISHVNSLLSEYVRAFDSRIHISEKQLYDDTIKQAQLSSEEADLDRSKKLANQLAVLETALNRLERVIGGDTFKGEALVGSGILKQGNFALIGPVALFASDEGNDAGLAEMKTNTAEPVVIDIGEKFVAQIKTLASTGSGQIPFDPSLGNAIKIAQTQETLIEHIKTGGPVMIPILLLAFVALVVGIFKFFEISSVKPSKPEDLQYILDALNRGDKQAAMERANSISGPFGELLRAGVEHSEDSKELIEEVMYERMLNTQPKLERMLPFIALTAGSAPLLGLLGTVTGMINTFKLITVFGTGDAAQLSSGISEALVTTEYGLIVAIPALLIHAVLSRKAKGVIGDMEQTSVGFINGLKTKA